MRFLRTRALQLGVDSLVVIIALMLAYAMRFEGMPPRHYAKQFLLVLPYLIILRIGLMLAFGTYRLVWRYVSLRDLPRIMVPIGLGTAGAVAARFLIPALAGWIGFPVNPRFATVPFGVLAAEMVLTATGIVAVRTLWRVLTERADRNRTAAVVAARPARRQKALLIGAGAAGVMVAREVKASPDTGFEVAGFLDDDKDKHGTIIQGHKVLGGSDQMGRFAAELEAELAIITIAKAPAKAIRRLVEQAEQCGLKVQIIPGLYEILSGRVSISKIRDVAIEDLLGREPVQLDEQAIGQFVSGKVVLVTGAGGSIG